MSGKDFSTEHLDGRAREIADGIAQWLADYIGHAPSGGGCKAFFSPEDWAARGERYGHLSELVLVHDGGDLAPFCNPDYGHLKASDAFSEFLSDRFGVFVEPCTGFYSAVYPIPT